MATTKLTGPAIRADAKRAPDLSRAWLAAYATIWAFTLAAAILVYAIPGAPALARQLLALKLTATHNPPPSAGLVLSIALNNTLHATWPLTLGLLGAHRYRLGRTLADAAVSANLLVPGLLVGAAIAAYGIRVLPYLPHVPVEWAGIAAGAGGWLIQRKNAMAARRIVSVATITTATLIAAAGLEARIVPHS